MIETAFTPLQSLAGGLLIGLSAVMLMALLGRIMGATGILAGVLLPASLADWSWRAAVVLGMLCGPWVVMLVTGSLPTIEIPATGAMLVIGGLLVGVGVTLGSGCTSGHGVCGIARFSLRSIAATLTFMATATITVFVLRHLLGA